MKKIYMYVTSVYKRLRAKFVMVGQSDLPEKRENLITTQATSVEQQPETAQRRSPMVSARQPIAIHRQPAASPFPEETLTGQVERFMMTGYEFRANQLNDATEYRLKNSADTFRILGEREENSLCMEAHLQGIQCWDRDIRRYVRSLRVPMYHPFREFMNQLPAWDGCDRMEALARRVSGDALWINGFHRWMRALTAQWLGVDSLHGNSVAPVLISRKQGQHKSTFCKLLIPDVLQAYYTDHYDLNAQGGAVQKLATFGLINLDEMDKYSEKKMTLLKNIMQMPAINIRRAHQKSYSALPRIASFIGTSNHRDILTDPTGSRRFLCVEVRAKIDVSSIDHAQLYAQLKAELHAGKPHWFTPEEEAAITRHNQFFQKTGPDNDLFFQHYNIPEKSPRSFQAKGNPNVEHIEWLSATAIYENLRKLHPATMRQTSPAHFAKTLTALGLERRRTNQANVYRVVVVTEEKANLPASA